MNKCGVLSAVLTGILTIIILIIILTTNPRYKSEDIKTTEDAGNKFESFLKKTLNVSEIEPPEDGDASILPKVPACGSGSTPPNVFGGRIVGGRSTKVNEHPWLVLLDYVNGNTGSRSYKCGGSIINERYILTAAHCLVGEPSRNLEIVSVRVGEHNLLNSKDCFTDEDGVEKCTTPVEFKIESTVVHPEFNENHQNDIGLIRLAADLNFTDFVMPICLPSGYELDDKDTLFAAGWGHSSAASKKIEPIKTIVDLPRVSGAECDKLYESKDFDIDESQLCAGGEKGKDSCQNDSGGPLMNYEKGYWYVEGIVSFGNGCSQKGWPGVYTNVRYFDKWIRANMKP